MGAVVAGILDDEGPVKSPARFKPSKNRGVLLVGPEMPRRGRFTLLVSDSFWLDVTEVGDTVRLDFRPRRIRERVELWRRKWGL
ncbi:hypothetical protein POL25_04520 [Nannocystis sp. bb15-2]|uniref:Uncharacterized protein n=2 Tax=Nannocystis bainbridge TaxID=2995303 RepID=A0ABT5DSM3_9BACT|nr:hypothetical protein [Nannocystis bainbridge]